MTDTGLTAGDAETIAALLDRRLSRSERRQLMERLDREPALYEVFVETVRYRQSKADGRAYVASYPSSRVSCLIPLTVAALLALAVIGPFLAEDANNLTGASLTRGLAEADRLSASLAGDWFEQGWRRTRGLAPLRSELDSAFRIGVHTVDLEVALRMGRAEDAGLLLRYIDSELRKVDASDHVRLSYTELLRELDQGLPPGEALQQVTTIEPQALELLEAGYGYAFGKWTEAGKLAARSDNRQLLRSRAFRRMLREVRKHEWTDVVSRHLEQIESMVLNRDVPLDLAKLEREFTAIIEES
jgi:hypothetical protein